MSKSAATIIRETNLGDKAIQIVFADGMYAVLYEDKPFNLRTLGKDITSAKYAKTLFVNRGYALAAARRLNNLFNSTQFTVKEINA